MKAYVFKFYIALNVGYVFGVIFFDNVCRGIHNFNKAFDSGHSALKLLRKLNNGSQRCKQSAYI